MSRNAVGAAFLFAGIVLGLNCSILFDAGGPNLARDFVGCFQDEGETRRAYLNLESPGVHSLSGCLLLRRRIEPDPTAIIGIGETFEDRFFTLTGQPRTDEIVELDRILTEGDPQGRQDILRVILLKDENEQVVRVRLEAFRKDDPEETVYFTATVTKCAEELDASCGKLRGTASPCFCLEPLTLPPPPPTVFGGS